MRLRDKVSIVTGGGVGLGRAVSLGLAEEGARVLVNYSRSAEDAERTAEDCRAHAASSSWPMKAASTSPASLW